MRILSLRTIIISSVVLLFVVALALFYYGLREKMDGIPLAEVNVHLQLGDVQMGMAEEDVIAAIGPGEFLHGMGGHGRKYEELGLSLGIAGDRDNDLFQRVSSIQFTNPEYTWFGIRVGDDRQEAADILEKNGFYETMFEGIFQNGEFQTSLSGDTVISRIQIWFQDKDLLDRVY